MSETFFQAHMPLLRETLAHVVQAQPWTYALVLFLISKLVNSQAAALTAIAPWGWRWGRTQTAHRLPAGELRLLLCCRPTRAIRLHRLRPLRHHPHRQVHHQPQLHHSGPHRGGDLLYPGLHPDQHPAVTGIRCERLPVGAAFYPRIPGLRFAIAPTLGSMSPLFSAEIPMSRVILLWSGGKMPCRPSATPGRRAIRWWPWSPLPRQRPAFSPILCHRFAVRRRPSHCPIGWSPSRRPSISVMSGPGGIERGVATRWGRHRRHRQRGGAPNWIRERCRPWGSPSTPALAATPRGVAGGHAGPRHRRPPLLRRYPGTGPEWVGRRLDATTLAELQQLAATRGLDACGEQGSTTPW